MSAGKSEQIENELACWLRTWGGKKWRVVRKSHKKDKTTKHRRERRRAHKDPETNPEYRRYCGWEY